RPPSSVININRRPLVLAGIELWGVDSWPAGFDVLLNLFHAPASVVAGWSADSRPENSYKQVAVIKNLLVDYRLRPVTHFRNGVRLPTSRQEHAMRPS
ncbi:hypothetical protein, partial [Xanthomonas campestris]|uniref:hypothetical protein n=1 Tax=Xanthomonas campestris TaxID=339 RepID=UPI0032E38A7D